VTEMQVLAECAACTNGQHFRQQSAQHELMQVDSRVRSMAMLECKWQAACIDHSSNTF